MDLFRLPETISFAATSVEQENIYRIYIKF